MVRPRAAYIHVPFCAHKCGYCNFTVIAGRDDLESVYLAALARELSATLRAPCQVDTLFLGGGTPTQLSVEATCRLLDMLHHWLPLRDDAEVTCEANPNDCTEEKLRLLRQYGVNRLSIGGQSFSRGKLEVLERRHTPEQLRDALETATAIFPEVALDLIFAAPGETLKDWHADLDAAIDSGVVHLSTYGLTIERGSAFYGRMLRGALVEVDEERQLEMYLAAIDRLGQVGWDHYEVSNFCLPGNRCRHNQTYWTGEFWWGFGAGAAAFLPAAELPAWRRSAEPIVGWRRVNHRSTVAYLRRIDQERPWWEECAPITREQWIREQLVFGLRQLDGVDLRRLDERWGEGVEPLFEPHLSRFLEQGLLMREDQHLRLTRRGLVISDSLWPPLLEPGT